VEFIPDQRALAELGWIIAIADMLVFSNNAGVQWGGYAYRPFSTSNIATSGEDTS